MHRVYKQVIYLSKNYRVYLHFIFFKPPCKNTLKYVVVRNVATKILTSQCINSSRAICTFFSLDELKRIILLLMMLSVFSYRGCIVLTPLCSFLFNFSSTGNSFRKIPFLAADDIYKFILHLVLEFKVYLLFVIV